MTKLLLGLNLAAAVAAFGASVWAAAVGDLSLRARHNAAAMLAAGYCAVIVAQIVGTPGGAPWADIARGLGVVAWPVVWVWPAVASTRRWLRLRAELESILTIKNEDEGDDEGVEGDESV